MSLPTDIDASIPLDQAYDHVMVAALAEFAAQPGKRLTELTDDIREQLALMIPAENAAGLAEAGVAQIKTTHLEHLQQIIVTALQALLAINDGSTADEQAALCQALMLRKNHDYGDSWKHMRIISITDQMVTKAQRLLQLEELEATGKSSEVAEGPESEYRDIVNYAIFESLKFLWPASEPEPMVRRHS